MTERRKDLLAIALLLGILVIFFSKILFTDKIIRAPDIINEYYWSVLSYEKNGFLKSFSLDLRALWDIFSNAGNTLEGGDVAGFFLVIPHLVYFVVSPPASVAWFIVLHLFLGAWGTWLCCRVIGTGRAAAFFGALVFALAPENASLINAGHVMKIATIAYAPWAFYFLERGFQSRRLVFFLTTALVLALQFFNTHWQIAFYTCLAVGAYGVCRSIGILVSERPAGAEVARLAGLNLVVLCFFLSTVAISLAPLANWSTETNRGVQSGSNQGKGGLAREEAMLWSMPPEETAAFVIPGMFGFSRQEGGENPTNITSYYWGRMVFTQTTSYLGLLPWLLVPLPLIFRRDRYTWLALGAVVGGILFSMGKYTPFYNFLFDYFPGVNRFRVPKMMMFIPVLGIALLAARGIDLLGDPHIRGTRAFRRYLAGLFALPMLLAMALGIQYLGREQLTSQFLDILARPTNYEQGMQLVAQRWINLMAETAIASIMALACAVSVWLIRRGTLVSALAPLFLMAIYVADTGRVNAKFMFLVDPPQRTTEVRTPVVEFLHGQSREYRTLPLAGDPRYYASHQIPVIFTPMPVQQVRWQNTLDNFDWGSSIPDMLNLRYVVFPAAQYQQEQASLGDKFVPVFTSPDGTEIVVENRHALPKAWLVPSVIQVPDPAQAFGILRNPAFDPRRLALVESPPALPLAPPNNVPPIAGEARVTRYEGERIDVTVRSGRNALLVLGEKYYRGWKAYVEGKETPIYPVNHTLRGIYLLPGDHKVEFRFDPLPFKVGKYLTLASFAFFAIMLGREWWRRKGARSEG